MGSATTSGPSRRIRWSSNNNSEQRAAAAPTSSDSAAATTDDHTRPSSRWDTDRAADSGAWRGDTADTDTAQPTAAADDPSSDDWGRCSAYSYTDSSHTGPGGLQLAAATAAADDTAAGRAAGLHTAGVEGGGGVCTELLTINRCNK